MPCRFPIGSRGAIRNLRSFRDEIQCRFEAALLIPRDCVLNISARAVVVFNTFSSPSPWPTVRDAVVPKRRSRFARFEIFDCDRDPFQLVHLFWSATRTMTDKPRDHTQNGRLKYEMNELSSSGKTTVMFRTYRRFRCLGVIGKLRRQTQVVIMGFRLGRFCDVVGISLCLALSVGLVAQTTEMGILTGKISDSSGAPVANATVTVTSAETGQTRGATTGIDGSYRLDGLPLGSYRLKVEAAGFRTVEIPTTTVAGGKTVLDEKLETATPTAQENLPNAPSSSTAPSLSDLGLTPEQTQGNLKEQALLDKRSHMLKIHQRMGLITAAPLIATVVTSMNAGGRNTSTASRDLHAALGGLTGDLYFITAYYAIGAPRVPGTETRGPIRFHKAMAWIHGPGMIMTPILGIMAFDQKSKGEKVHGIASAHGPVSIVTAGAFGAALLSVSVKF